jgi:acyl-CoA-dependent ceramide synthase
MAILIPQSKSKQKGSVQRRNNNNTQSKPILSSINENENHNTVDNPHKQQKSRTALQRYKRFATKHTWVLPLALLLCILALYTVNPTESNILHNFIFLSYKQRPNPAFPNAKIQYGKGPWDIAFVLFYAIVLSFTREFIMQELLRPLARTYIKSRGKQARFMEQMYTAIYFGVLGPAGLYVMRQTPVWYFNTRGMYEGFPHRTHEAAFKFYYLFEAAYWAQQALVMLLGMEKPRKDFKELVMHHIITLTLIGLSYRFHFTYLGIGVYVTHDISDFFLAVSFFRSGSVLESMLIFFTALQIPSLYSARYNDPLFRYFDWRLGLSAPCIESPHSLLSVD